MGLNSGGFSPWKAGMGRGTAKRGGGWEQSQSRGKNEEPRSSAGGCAISGCREIFLELYLEVLSSLVRLSSAWISPSTKSPGKAQAWELWEWLVGRRASGGKQRDHIAGEVSVSFRERKAGSRMSDSWERKKSSWTGEEQGKCCSSALHIPGRGRIKVSFGHCFSRTWPQVKCSRQLPPVGNSELVSHPAPSQSCTSAGLVSKIAPSLCFLWRILGENKSSRSESPESPRCPGSCWANTALVWNQIWPAQNSSRDN